MRETFYGYQERRLRVLLGWALGSIVAGLPGLVIKDKEQRSFALQNLTWGAIDAVIAGFGIRGVRSAGAPQAADEEIGPEERKAAANFRRIVAINTALDVCYVVGGRWLVANAGERTERVGMGRGIVAQGLFLLLFDGALTIETSRRWLKSR